MSSGMLRKDGAARESLSGAFLEKKSKINPVLWGENTLTEWSFGFYGIWFGEQENAGCCS